MSGHDEDCDADEYDADDHVHHVDVSDISAVANDLFLPVSSIVQSMILEAQRQQQQQHSNNTGSSRSVEGARREDHHHHSNSNTTAIGSPATISIVPIEQAPLLSPRPQSAATVGSPCGEPVHTTTMKSVRVSLANVLAANGASEGEEDEESCEENDGGEVEQRDGGSAHPASHNRNASAAPSAKSSRMSSGTTSGPLALSHSGLPIAKDEPSLVQTKKRLVKFASSEIERVHVYEVDNSLFISIEYSRPVFGWLLLLTAMIAGVFSDAMYSHEMAINPNSAFTVTTWNSLGLVALMCFVLLPMWYFLVRPTKVERSFLSSKSGMVLLLVTALVGALIHVSKSSTAHLTGQWRSMALSAVHPALIVLFGKVFRNTVFLEEAVGSGVMLCSFVVAMFPADLRTDKWEFAEILSLSSGIYTASFLFLAVKARANRVSVPVVAGAVSVVRLVMMMLICVISSQISFNSASLSDDGSSSSSSSASSDSSAARVDDAMKHAYLLNDVFGFVHSDAKMSLWIGGSIATATSLTCYLMTLRFIPPLTVSVTLCLQALTAQFVSFFLFFNDATAPWPVCPPPPRKSMFPFADTPTPVPMSAEQLMMCNGRWDGASAQNIVFSVGCCIAALSGGYLVYVSSIKRSKVDRLLKHLSSRRIPKNPYQSRGSVTSGQRSPTSPGMFGSAASQRLQNEFRRMERSAKLLLLNPSAVDRTAVPVASAPSNITEQRPAAGVPVSRRSEATNCNNFQHDVLRSGSGSDLSLRTMDPSTPSGEANSLMNEWDHQASVATNKPSSASSSWNNRRGVVGSRNSVQRGGNFSSGPVGIPVVVHSLTPPRGNAVINNTPQSTPSSASALDAYYDEVQ